MKPYFTIISSLLLLFSPGLNLAGLTQVPSPIDQSQSVNCNPEKEGEDGAYSPQQQEAILRQITVKVIGDNNGGSGTLLARQGNNYLVASNSHTLVGANLNNIRVETIDGQVYPAQIIPNVNFQENNLDLTILKFTSNKTYCLPKIANNEINKQLPIIAAGYSGGDNSFISKEGMVEKITELVFKKGYEIGYTSDIEQGMSGGPIINRDGELVGINAMAPYPVLNHAYVYADGKRPTFSELRELRKLSWGITLKTVLAQIEPELMVAYRLPIPRIKQIVPESKLVGWLQEVEAKAKKITVKIDSSSESNGSGVIIAKDGDVYTVLTANHVVCERQLVAQPCGNFNYKLMTHDGNVYPIDKSTIQFQPGVDLAVVKFNSRENYPVATLANYNPTTDDYVFTTGYPKLKEKSDWRFSLGQVYSKERGLLTTTSQLDLPNSSAGGLNSVTQSAASLAGGYELVYTTITFGGMSGGPVLDSQGRVIGIHGKSEGEHAYDAITGDSGTSDGNKVQIGNSLGIPTSTFLAVASRINVQPQILETTPPPQLTATEVESIRNAILSVDVTKTNTSASQWLERGNQLWRLRRYNDSIQAFEQAIEQKPDFVYLGYYGKGLGHYGNKQYEEAITAFKQVLESRPDFVPARFYLSVIYRELKQVDLALTEVDQAIKLQSNDSRLYNQKFLILMDAKRYAQAEESITKAIEINPIAPFYNNRGVVYSRNKKWELALVDFKRALEGNPQYAHAYANGAFVYYNKGIWNSVISSYTKAIEIDPQYPLYYNNRGVAYYNNEQWQLALNDFSKVVTLEPRYARGYKHLGEVYAQFGDIQKARENLQQAARLFQDQRRNADYRETVSILQGF
ncbi:tetratricopeptide repeat-containing S1 family peptidase [Cylindrospermopsis raciborskii]|uniref:tetratricopeptide repeat-containing S1 family peptidase n=1 Tax=Cylindrospermopsis raciborskii TaxID=77022 RepID=UPI001141FD83|nr:tetratricopeptide repeat-containing serine protease family protein [Cylindrospermopsis raciborskii]TPX29801.1 serine protease [Cylindrospermopsis raciborskii GIHE 2018]